MAKFLSKRKIILLVILVLAALLGWIETTNQAPLFQPQQEETLRNHTRLVIDGDTLELATKERVRLIGIDTPEKGEMFYEEAKAKLKELIESKEVRLEKDVSEKDRYGRLLRYVYVEDTFVNLEMVRQGYAKVSTYSPDVRHAEEFRAAEREARENKRCLWK